MKRMCCMLSLFLLFPFAACAGKAPVAPLPPQEDFNEETTMQGYEITEKNFKNKTVVFYGDSIAYGLTLNAGEKNYPTLLAEALDFDVFNFALSGSALTHARESVSGLGTVKSGIELISEHQNVNRDAHYAFIAYGANDFFTQNYCAAVGTAEDKPASAEEVETFCGAIYYAVNLLREENPDIRILLLTPIPRNAPKYNADMNTLDAYVDAVETQAKLLGCRSINLYHIFDGVSIKPGEGYFTDNTHPAAAGHRHIADYLLTIDKR